MTLKEIVDGLQFTLDMFLFDPTTGEIYPEPRNDMDKITIDACKGAIELLEKQPCEDCISRKQAINEINKKVLCYTYEAREIIENLPSVQPQPKRGKWIKANGEENLALWTCDQCGCKIYSETECDRKKFHAWCGKCGCRMDADMRESEGE